MSVLSLADHMDLQIFLEHVLLLHKERALSTKEAKAYLTGFIDEVDQQIGRAGANMKALSILISQEEGAG